MQQSMFKNFKSQVRAMPVIGAAAARFMRLIAPGDPKTSEQYWNDRYTCGGDSGSGSYGRLSRFKADVINDFVQRNDIVSVAELGSGDGAQLELLNIKDYTGVDVSQVAVAAANEKHIKSDNKRFLVLGDFQEQEGTFDAVMSLDVIYHLFEDEVFEAHMAQLFESAERFVIIYASNEDKPTDDPHVRHRNFSSWIERNKPDWPQVQKIDNPYPFDWKDPRNTSFADFYIYQKSR